MEITNDQIDQALNKLMEDQRVSGGNVWLKDWKIIVHLPNGRVRLRAVFHDEVSREVDIMEHDRWLHKGVTE